MEDKVEPNYSLISSVRAFEVIILIEGIGEGEQSVTVIADGFVDCAEIMNERVHELGLAPFALKSIKALPRIMLTNKGGEALGGEIC